MLDMFLKLDKALRTIVLVVGAVVAIFKITESKEREIKTSEEGFQIKEFDDIW